MMKNICLNGMINGRFFSVTPSGFFNPSSLLIYNPFTPAGFHEGP